MHLVVLEFFKGLEVPDGIGVFSGTTLSGSYRDRSLGTFGHSR